MPDLPVLFTHRLILRILDRGAAPLVLDYYWRNRSFHQPWFPDRSDQVFTLRQQKSNLEKEHADFLEGRAVLFWLFLRADPDRIIGRLAFTSIIHGCYHGCLMAWHLDQACEGSGLAQEAAGAAIPVIFRDFGIHRIEANIMPANRRSIALAERLGFEPEGYSVRYLHINGRWEDHLHYVLLSDGRQGTAAETPSLSLETDSLVLRPLFPADAPSALEYYQRNKDHLESWSPPPGENLDTARAWLSLMAAQRREFSENRRLLLGVFLKDRPDRLVGILDFYSIAPLPYSRCELGFSIDKLLSGRGLMLEALSQAIPFVFARYALKRMAAACCEGNQRSIKLLGLLGFSQEGVSRQAVYVSGQWQDVVNFGLLQEDFHPV